MDGENDQEYSSLRLIYSDSSEGTLVISLPDPISSLTLTGKTVTVITEGGQVWHLKAVKDQLILQGSPYLSQ